MFFNKINIRFNDFTLKIAWYSCLFKPLTNYYELKISSNNGPKYPFYAFVYTNAICYCLSEVEKEMCLKQMLCMLYDLHFGEYLFHYIVCTGTTFWPKMTYTSSQVENALICNTVKMDVIQPDARQWKLTLCDALEAERPLRDNHPFVEPQTKMLMFWLGMTSIVGILIGALCKYPSKFWTGVCRVYFWKLHKTTSCPK